MENYYSKVREYLLDLEVTIVSEDKDNEVFVIEKEDDGVINMVVVIADPLVIIEQALFTLKDDSADVLKQILMKNRDMIHGAMVLDEEAKTVIYRDTLEASTLDLTELEASIESLSLLLSEFGQDILDFVK
ncbi:MAG: hypothetical protein JXL97_13420 [Bacteroidales bacterium]|nr:hypothetical protein [Bacteroidales bacterium]